MTTETPELRVVDVGTKLGNALGEFIRRGGPVFGDPTIASIQPGECLGVDRQPRFEQDLTRRGYQFSCVDLTQTYVMAALPEADYYLAWDFLEHLPSEAWSASLLQVMLAKARKGVWLRMPSFEQDGTGCQALEVLGLRFTWTNWTGHTSHFTLAQAAQAIEEYKKLAKHPELHVSVRPGKRVQASDDPCVVPLEAPKDTVKYDISLGHKTVVNFNPPLVAQWEVIIKA